jgi:hypothetical protein
MPSKPEKKNASDRSRDKSLHVKLDKRILAALKQESDARGGQQEHRITEEALTLYLGLKTILAQNYAPGLIKTGINPGDSRMYSRIVE